MPTVRNTLKKHFVHSIFIGMLAILLLRTGGADAAALALACGQWNIIPSPNASSDNSLSSAAVISPTDVWAVGTAYNPNGQQAYTTLAEHWDGTQWSIIPTANPGLENRMKGIAAVATNDVWAVGSYTTDNGQNTLVEHWNGTQWSVVPSPNSGIYSELNAVAVVAANDVWAVGDNALPTITTLIEHWDGTQWNIVPGMDRLSGSFNAISAISANDIWAVGVVHDCPGCDAPLIEHWDGTQWSVVPSRDSHHSFGELTGVAASSQDSVWATGSHLNDPGTVYRSFIEHWNGTGWRVVKSPHSRSTGLSGIAAVSANDIWAVGAYEKGAQKDFHSLSEHWNGTNWQVVPGPKAGTHGEQLFAVAVGSTNNIWAVGDYFDNNGNVNTLTEFYC